MGRRLLIILTTVIGALAHDVAIACEPIGEPKSWRTAGVLEFVAVAGRGPLASGDVRGRLVAGRSGAGAVAPGPIVLVPWAFGPDCKPRPWNPTGDGVWSPAPDVPAFYTGRLRSRDQWIGGVPTVDIQMARLQPVWQGGDADRERYRTASGSLLTPMEFFDFYAILPTDQELDSRQPQALARVDAWESTHRELAAREPALSMLRSLHMMWVRKHSATHIFVPRPRLASDRTPDAPASHRLQPTAAAVILRAVPDLPTGVLDPLVSWAEEGKAQYPLVARYRGTGNTDDPQNFVCSAGLQGGR